MGEDTTLSQIIQMVSDAAATKAPIAKVADRVSGVFVPAVITIAVVTILVWLLAGQSIGFALARGISVLVISCPCALGLATPVAIMVGNGMGAKNGIMFKTAVSLEEAGKMQIVALDKTGTITSGEPKVTDHASGGGHRRKRSCFPWPTPWRRKANIRWPGPFWRSARNGVRCRWRGDRFPGRAGQRSDRPAWTASSLDRRQPDTLSPARRRFRTDVQTPGGELAEDGKTPLFFAKDGRLVGIIAVADVIKEDSPQAVRELQNMGIRVVMLTGDNERTAKAIGAQAGVDEVIAGVLPDGKESVIRALKEQGQGSHGGRRDQRCSGPDPSRYRHRHRSGNGYRHRRGRRGADEEPVKRCSGGHPVKPGNPAKHP